jgi:hypothetical protein
MTTTTLDEQGVVCALKAEPMPAINTACLDALVSIFPNAFRKTPTENRRLVDVLDDIRGSRYAGPVASVREDYRSAIGETGDSGKAKKGIADAKKKLPAFCISGTAVNRTKPDKHSGLLQIDLDALGDSLPAVRERIKQDPHVAFGFISPSGDGLKLGLRIDSERHKASFAAAETYFKDRYSLTIDPACKDPLRLCFVSHDPEMWTNPDAVVLTVESCPTETLPPQQKTAQKKPNSSESTSTSCILRPTSYITSAEVAGRIKARAEAMASLEAAHPGLPKLYESLIERRYDAEPGRRNDFITQASPFLYRAVAPAVALKLVGAFYDCNRAIFNDSRERHIREAQAMLESVASTYLSELSPGEREIYSALSVQEQDVFRICRDLALLPEQKRPPLTFFLSFGQCGGRIGVFPIQAQRIMRKLSSIGIIALVKRGTRRAAGVRCEAGTYQWQLQCESAIL